jgi:hypothetical protein
MSLPPLYIWDYIQGNVILHLKTHPDAVPLPRSQTLANHRTIKPEIDKCTFHGTFDPKTRVLLFFSHARLYEYLKPTDIFFLIEIQTDKL